MSPNSKESRVIYGGKENYIICLTLAVIGLSSIFSAHMDELEKIYFMITDYAYLSGKYIALIIK
jgi:hypothetical protein